MKRRARAVGFVILFGAAAIPLLAGSFAGYVKQGTVSPELAGHSFYVAIGEVSLYRVGFLGSQASTGQTAESAAAVRVDKRTGRVERIVTLQPNVYGASGSSNTENTAIATGSPQYVIGDLLGGMNVADIEPYGTWLDALRAMRQAISELRAVGQFAGTGQPASASSQVPPVVVGQPQVVVQPPVEVQPAIVEPPPFFPPAGYDQPPGYYQPPQYYQPPDYYQPPQMYPPPPDVQQPLYVAPPPAIVPSPIIVQRPPTPFGPPVRVPPAFPGGAPPIVRQPPFDGGGAPPMYRQPLLRSQGFPAGGFGRR